MPSNSFKQPQQLNVQGGGGQFLNGGSGDSVIGGLIQSVPAGLNISQGIQTLPGDRMVVGEEDIAALTKSSVGTLFGGIYTYVRTNATSTATPTRGRAVFWDTTVANKQFQVTPDEGGTTGVTLFAGVAIQTLTKGNAWWIQAAGPTACQFRTTMTGTPAIGSAIYLAAAGAGADVGTFDLFDGAATTLTYTLLGNALNRYVGPALTAPVNNTISVVTIPLGRTYRW